MNNIEKYAIQTNELIADVSREIRLFFLQEMMLIFDPRRVRIVITSGFWGLFSKRKHGAVPYWVMGRTIFIMKGVINAEGYHRGNTMDLTLAQGWASLIHEVFHVYQYLERGHWWTLKNLWLPWATGKQHPDIAAEMEAIDVENRAFNHFRKLQESGQLSSYRHLR